MKVQEIVEKTQEYNRLERIIKSIDNQINDIEKQNEEQNYSATIVISGSSDSNFYSHGWLADLTLDELRKIAEDLQAKKDALEV